MPVLHLVNTNPSRLRLSFNSLSLAAHRFAEWNNSGTPRPQALLLIGRQSSYMLSLALEIHSESNRRDNTFVRLPCELLPTARKFDRLMYGTSRIASVEPPNLPGELRSISGGTLLLDNVNLLSGESQQDLFAVLDAQQVVPLCASDPIAIDVETMASVDADLIDRDPDECVLMRLPICKLAAYLAEIRVLGVSSRVQGIAADEELGNFANHPKWRNDLPCNSPLLRPMPKSNVRT